MSAEALADLHLTEQWATRLIEGRGDERDIAVAPSAAAALDLLPGLYDDWVLMECERIRQRILHALEALSERLAAAGRFADAFETALLTTSAESLRETTQRVLIKAHLAEGNRTEARRSYRADRDLLRPQPATGTLRGRAASRRPIPPRAQPRSHCRTKAHSGDPVPVRRTPSRRLAIPAHTRS